MHPTLILLLFYLFMIIKNLYKAYKTKEIGIGKDVVSLEVQPPEFWFVVILNIALLLIGSGVYFILF